MQSISAEGAIHWLMKVLIPLMRTKKKTKDYIMRSAAVVFLFVSGVVTLISAVESHAGPNLVATSLWGVNPDVPQARGYNLTFADRVAYQWAIEDVYWRHRIWPKENAGPKPSLDAVMSQTQIEKKVEDYLCDSQALEDYWQRPITHDQLQAEMERMAQHTKQPQVLREIFQALGDDPFVIAQCLARPVLAQRLAADPTVVARVSRACAKLFAADTAASTGNRFRVTNPSAASYQLPAISTPSGACIDDMWIPTTLTSAPSARDEHTAVWTGSEMIVWGGGQNNGNTFEHRREIQS